MTTVLDPTGEQLLIPAAYTNPADPPHAVLGERIDTARGEHTWQPILRVADAPPEEFAYGKPISRWDHYLPWPGMYTRAALPEERLYDYMDRAQPYVARGEPTRAARIVTDLLKSREPSGRVTILEVPFKDWAESSNHDEFVWALRVLYRAYQDEDILRSDAGDVHGTTAWMATYGAMPFLLVERSRLVQVSGDEPVVMRLLEAVKVSDPESAMAVINQLSVTEEVRVWLQLNKLRLAGLPVSAAEREYVHQYASRATIRSDTDVAALVREHRYPPGPTPRQRAAERLRWVANKVITPPKNPPKWLKFMLGDKPKHRA